MNANPLRPAIVSLILLTLITGVLYPLAVTLVGQVAFPWQANGSLIQRDGQVVGSALIGQPTDDDRYFWSRPSAVNYMLGSSLDALGLSGATNLGLTSAALAEVVAARRAAFRTAHGLTDEVAVPADMLFASGSGLDPHISPESARLQVGRVAGARGLPVEQVAALVEQFVELPQLLIAGQPRVNVLLLNIALDAIE